MQAFYSYSKMHVCLILKEQVSSVSPPLHLLYEAILYLWLIVALTQSWILIYFRDRGPFQDFQVLM